MVTQQRDHATPPNPGSKRPKLRDYARRGNFVELSLAIGVSIVESVEAGPASFPPATGRRVKRTAYLVALIAFCAAAPAAGDGVRDELAREILRRVPQWPKAQVEIPLEVYEKFVRDELLGPVPPKPPEAVWVERVSWTVRPAEAEAVVEAALDVVSLPGLMSRHARVLGADVAWRDVAIDGKPAALRRGDDGWFWLDNPQPGRLRITAKAVLKPKTSGDRRTIAWLTGPAGWSSAAFESDAAWEARFSRASAPIIGGGAGTRGTVGLVPGDRLEVTWQKPQPVVHRAAQIESAADIGWTLAEGVHQVRAVLALRLWGGEVAELAVDLPAGADRVSITGPDVREVQVSGGAARVFLRGPITQRTRLSVAFESPRAKTGRMSLPAFGVRSASQRGGTLAIAGGAGAVLLEMESPGLAPMALHDLPDAVRGLLAAAPVYAYQLSGGSWEARIDVVDMTEFPVRETLVDSAVYTMLYRPDGSIMTKVLYEVRNRGQQYMKVDLPQGARLLVARVAEQQKNLARGPGETVFVPLEKSVLTTAGLISFPVELVYLTKGPPLARQGRLSLPLPRTDLPVAYARCALEVPDGLNVRQWQGTLREVPSWSSETVELEFEYGRGHLAAGLKPPEPKITPVKTPPAKTPQPRPEVKEGKKPEPAKPDASKPSPVQVTFINGQATTVTVQPPVVELAPEDVREKDAGLSVQAKTIQGKNYYRAGVDYYSRRDYNKASELFNKVIEVTPNSVEADNARKYLGNVEIALGREDKGKTGDRGLRAQAKAVQLSQQEANEAVVERQHELLQHAEQSLKAGKEEQAEAAYKVAVGLSGKLQAQGEEAREQEAVVRKAREFLQQRAERRKDEAKELEDLQKQVQSLKQNIVEKGGRDLQVAVDALVQTDMPAQPPPAPDEMRRLEPAGAQPRTAGREPLGFTPQPRAPQVQLGQAIAEQQVSRGKAGDRFVSPGAGRAYGSMTASGLAALTTGDVLTAADNRAQQLRQQVEQLKGIKTQLDAKAEPDAGRLSTQEYVRQLDEDSRRLTSLGMRISQIPDGSDVDADGKRRADLVRERDELSKTLHEKTASYKALAPKFISGTELPEVAPAPVLGKMITEKAKQTAAQAGHATELARQGRIAEAQDLIENLEKDQATTARAAQALAKTGSAQVLTKTYAGAMTLERAMRPDFSDAAPRFEVASVIAAAVPPAPPPVASTDALWGRATELRQAMQFGEAIQVLDRLIAINPNDDRAHRWREDLSYLESQSRMVATRPGGAPAAGAEAPRLAVTNGATRYLAYPGAREWENLTSFRRQFATAAETPAVAETRERLAHVVSLDLQRASVSGVLASLGDMQPGLKIVVDPEVSAKGIDLSSRMVDLKAKDVSVESVLGLVLGADLGYMIGPGYIQITTREKLQRSFTVATYPMQGLAGDIAGGTELMRIISATVNSQSDPSVAAWTDEGGPAEIEQMNGRLIISQTARGHAKVQDLLQQLLREGAAGAGGQAQRPQPATHEWKAVADARHTLDEARKAVVRQSQELDKVRFNVQDLTRGGDDDKKLAEFVVRNYAWALQPQGGQGGGGGAGGGAAPQGGPQPPRSSVRVVGRQFTQNLFPDVASNKLEQQVEQGARVNLGATNVYTGGATATGAGTLNINGIVVDRNANALVMSPQGQVTLGGGTLILRNGASTFSGVRTFDDSGSVTLQAGDGNLAVLNDARVAGNVEVLLERLRTNLGQRVAVGSRNALLTADAARAAGIAWKQGANGVTYAVINEGQLLSLMDIEQRMPVGQRAAAPQGEVRQEAVVGTPAVLANGGLVSIAQAADDANSLSYNGNTLRVAHDDYLLVDNGGYLTAVKSGRMQHWAAETPPVRFPGVPAVVTVPVVGRTVKFEKTLLDPSDSLELVAEYTWQGEEK